MTSPTDKQLVEETRRGNQESYKELVAKYQGHVYGLAYSLVGNWADAQDIAQETFIRAYTNIDQLENPARFAAWLRRVTFSVAMNWLKSFRPKLFEKLDGRVDLDQLDIPDFQPGPAEVVEKRALAEAVLQAVESLPPKYRVPLTMFHLDGLSYRKVADFLDIPLGTAKSLIRRAKEKLKPALGAYAGEEIAPVVQEVFNEYKLPEEFAMKVLKGVEKLDYRLEECTFAGSVTVCMKYLEENVTQAFIKGVSGGAFKLLWHPRWCPSNNTLLVLGTEPIKRTFGALGYEYEFIPKTDNAGGEEFFRQKIMDSIQRGCPVIVEGVVGPPECGVVTGYEKEGEKLLGRSYFHHADDYYQKDNWYEECYCLIVIGEKIERPELAQILRESLSWAVHLARSPKWVRLDGESYVCGLAAYDAWAEALLKDNFPENDLEALTFRCLVNSNVTFCGLLDARKGAVAFLNTIASADKRVTEHVLAAARMYYEEVAILESMVHAIPYSWQPEEKRLEMADPTLRQNLANIILEAKTKDEQAVEHLEQVLEGI